LPLPASKGLAFPFLLTSMGTPLHTYNLRSETKGVHLRDIQFAHNLYFGRSGIVKMYFLHVAVYGTLRISKFGYNHGC